MSNRERRWREPAFVYRLWDAEGNLLYIGSAYDPDHRCKEHRKKPWWAEVASRTDELHPARGTAYVEEMKAIAAESPKYNRMGQTWFRVEKSDAIRRRDEAARLRAVVQREAASLARETRDELKAQGVPHMEAWAAGTEAEFAFIEASGLFPGYVERQRRHRAPR